MYTVTLPCIQLLYHVDSYYTMYTVTLPCIQLLYHVYCLNNVIVTKLFVHVHVVPKFTKVSPRK